MKRRRAEETGIMASLDSFLDIITNTLGLLILVATLSVVSSRDIAISLGTPLMEPAPEHLKRVCFECRGNRVVPVDEDFAQRDRQAIIDSSAPVAERHRLIQAFNARAVSNGFHRYEFRPAEATRVDGDGRVLVLVPEVVLRPVEGPVGDAPADLPRADTHFRRRLADLAADRHWVFFIVREDSFEALRAARKVARDCGFGVGWMPLPAADDMVFSPFGAEGDRLDERR